MSMSTVTDDFTTPAPAAPGEEEERTLCSLILFSMDASTLSFHSAYSCRPRGCCSRPRPPPSSVSPACRPPVPVPAISTAPLKDRPGGHDSAPLLTPTPPPFSRLVGAAQSAGALGGAVVGLFAAYVLWTGAGAALGACDTGGPAVEAAAAADAVQPVGVGVGVATGVRQRGRLGRCVLSWRESLLSLLPPGSACSGGGGDGHQAFISITATETRWRCCCAAFAPFQRARNNHTTCSCTVGPSIFSGSG